MLSLQFSTQPANTKTKMSSSHLAPSSSPLFHGVESTRFQPRQTSVNPSLSPLSIGRRLFAVAAATENAAVTAPTEVVYGAIEARIGAASVERDSLPAGLRRELMPNHVAVIMDGNRRWARENGIAFGSGYEAGVQALRRMVELCCRWDIGVLTVFAFSADNWLRPKVEVDFLMGLFERGLKHELEDFVRADVKISVIGDSSKLPKHLHRLISTAMEMTKDNSRLHLIVAVNYSGQYDVVQACQRIASQVKDGLVDPKDIDEFVIESQLQTNCTDFPYPDLLIRTSGELRVSNFLLWQLAYTELFFSQSHWPEFGEDEFVEALLSFQMRQRRYGKRSS